MFHNITIGCDPEMFLKNKVNGKVVSAHDLLPGTKREPHPVNGGAVQVDGVAAEFNIVPCSSATDFSNMVQTVKSSLKSMVEDYDLQIIPSYEFEPLYFDSLPKESKTLGCDPDYNGWTEQPNPPPDGQSTTLRTASGHLHGGWTKNRDPYCEIHFKDCCAVARQLDYYVGIYTLLWDTDVRRRTLYGKAGAFRAKPYGIEYRTPSNVWLRYPTLYTWVWNAMYKGINSMLTGQPRLYDQFGDLARQVIDNNDINFVRSKEFLNIHRTTGNSWPKW